MSLLVPPIPGCTIMASVKEGASVMSTHAADSKGLHLPDLVIKGFRGIEDLTVSRLGRVNLISGKNGVGKTSLLDAVRVYAARGDYFVLTNLLRTREELVRKPDDEDAFFDYDLESIFYGRGVLSDSYISIGPKDETLRLGMKIAWLSDEYLTRLGSPTRRHLSAEDFKALDFKALKVEFQNMSSEFPFDDRLLEVAYYPDRMSVRHTQGDVSEPSHEILCETLGPGLPNNTSMASSWDTVALTDAEASAVDALNLIFAGNVKRVAFVWDGTRSIVKIPVPDGRMAIVKLKTESRPVPLRSLGDGAVRLFSVALALANSKDGFLLIDEVENGIHYSVQYDFWKMVLRTAYENNVQVFATTHSWDCIRSFAYAAMETEEVEGTLVRLHHHRRNGKVRAIEYSESDLRVVAEQGIEVR